MKEDIFFKVGYSNYLEKEKKCNWTSKILKKITEHKIIISMLGVILMCFAMNFWLIYKFINIIETSALLFM